MGERIKRRRTGKPADSGSKSLGTLASRRSRAADKEKRLESMIPDGLEGAYVRSKLHEETLKKAGLSSPSDYQGDMPELPEDVAAVDHDELSNLMYAFQSAHASCVWEAAKAYIEADIAEDVMEYLRSMALLNSQESNDAKRRADAETDEMVLAWKGRYKTCYHNYIRFRDLARTIESKIKVVSRTGGFKEDDNDASDRTARSKPSAGMARRSRRSRDA